MDLGLIMQGNVDDMTAPNSRKAPSRKPEYKPSPREIKKVRDERAKRAPRLKVSKSTNGVEIGPDHPDGVTAEALLMEAIGTTDPHFLREFLRQLAEATGSEYNEGRLGFMISVVKGIKPRDQIEAMLALQMAAVHTATMNFSRSLEAAQFLKQRDSAERTFNKLTRTFVSQMDALKRYRSGGTQTVTVQHVNVSEGGQAIVGNVTQRQRDLAANAAQPLVLTQDSTQPMLVIEGEKGVPVAAQRYSKKK